jgi:hypothetical protein
MANVLASNGAGRQRARTFRNIALAVVSAAVAYGCTHAPTQKAAQASSVSASSPWAAPTSTVQWNEYASELIAAGKVGQFPALRTLAYVNVAINNAIVAAQAQGVKPEGAVASAAAGTLAHFFPKEAQAIAERLANERFALGAAHRTDFSAGMDIGASAAADVVAMARADGAARSWSGTAPTGPDKWSSLSTPPSAPAGAQLGSVRPFFLTSASEFRAPPPPALSSPEFRATLDEVRNVSNSRTYQQLRYARYWENLTGAFTAGVWNELAREMIAARPNGEAESARVLAVMHMAGFDAILACHESKYVYWVPRPTQLDSEIRVAVGVPNHPSYPSNHACISGAMGLVLDAHFPEQRGRFAAMARQAAESRIYGGIHYRIDVDAGLKIADRVAARALETGLPTARAFVPHARDDLATARE